jgi:hypothetical protein
MARDKLMLCLLVLSFSSVKGLKILTCTLVLDNKTTDCATAVKCTHQIGMIIGLFSLTLGLYNYSISCWLANCYMYGLSPKIFVPKILTSSGEVFTSPLTGSFADNVINYSHYWWEQLYLVPLTLWRRLFRCQFRAFGIWAFWGAKTFRGWGVIYPLVSIFETNVTQHHEMSHLGEF